jgi:small subunit ribosomal protein S4
MARYTGPKSRLCRREGEHLFGTRCQSGKCSLDKAPGGPGQHGSRPRRKTSEYGIQLREKQKVRIRYGVLERQFRRYYHNAVRSRGVTGETLLVTLERRLDNLVYRLGFAPSRPAARQLVRHRHFSVNDQIVDIPSYQVAPGQVIKVRDKSKRLDIIHLALRDGGRGTDLSWLRVDKARLEGELLAIPSRMEIPTTAQEQLIVELYSR